MFNGFFFIVCSCYSTLLIDFCNYVHMSVVDRLGNLIFLAVSLHVTLQTAETVLWQFLNVRF